MSGIEAQVNSGSDLRGRRFWVTGASRGIGRATAEALMAAGADVAVTARSKDALDELVEAAKEYAVNVMPLAGSVASEEDVASIVAAIRHEWSTIHGLVNAAGISPHFKEAVDVSAEEWREVIDVNLTGMFLCSRGIFPFLEEGASVVNVSSIIGRVGGERLSAYAASKGGVEAFTKSLALEWAAKGVRVNSLAPGYVSTDMTEGLRSNEKWNNRLTSKIPLGRFGESTEVASAALFLLSGGSSYMTGSSLTLDGGWTAG